MPEETVNNTEENNWKDAPQDDFGDDGNTIRPVQIMRKSKMLNINEARNKWGHKGDRLLTRLTSRESGIQLVNPMPSPK
jgi:hypothetical protein